ncbi:GntR family transcriptional regulator [Amycolatopsis sp. RM579]|uniref:GntR family transcriptional regulator n=2 Tax=Amycolatopsis pithecellobii TaxID=664692 RepID=A0A6N7Z4C8_9PSEU|nr:GntR family transcriptional regulator [Amycolatopsis pithecellobii]
MSEPPVATSYDGFTPIGPRRAFEGAVEQIADRIRVGDLGKGDRLPSERDLAGQMRISRPTLREAVRVLTKAGVVEVRPGPAGGIFVLTDYVPIEFIRAEQNIRLAEMGADLEARRVLEPSVAKFAARTAIDWDFDRMQETIHAEEALLLKGGALEREDRLLQLDTQFHLRMAHATGNASIVTLMRGLLKRLGIGQDLALRMPAAAEWTIEAHKRTLAAIRARDDSLIDAVVDESLRKMEDAWEEATARKLRRPMGPLEQARTLDITGTES